MNKPTLMNRDIEITQSLVFGDIFVLKEIASRLNIEKVLGKSKQGTLALWQAIAHMIDPHSRSSALDLAHNHAVYGIMSLNYISEHEVEENMDWLLSKKDRLEEIFGKVSTKFYPLDHPHPGFKVVKMLAMILMQYLKKEWRCIARTVREELSSLGLLTVLEISIGGTKRVMVSTPHPRTQERLDSLGIKLPEKVSLQGCIVQKSNS